MIAYKGNEVYIKSNDGDQIKIVKYPDYLYIQNAYDKRTNTYGRMTMVKWDEIKDFIKFLKEN